MTRQVGMLLSSWPRIRSPYELLAIVNAVLANGGPWPRPLPTDRRGTNGNAAGKAQLREDLITMLAAGSSVWQVSSDGTGLTRRVNETSGDAIDQAVSAADANPKSGSAAKQIRTAWRAIYKLDSEPATAYREAVKAVESAAHAVVQPNHSGATLGSMLGELRANAASWMLAIPGKDGSGDIAPLLAMIGLALGRPGMAARRPEASPRGNARGGRDSRPSCRHARALVHHRRCPQEVGARPVDRPPSEP